MREKGRQDTESDCRPCRTTVTIQTDTRPANTKLIDRFAYLVRFTDTHSVVSLVNPHMLSGMLPVSADPERSLVCVCVRACVRACACVCVWGVRVVCGRTMVAMMLSQDEILD